MVTSGYPTFGLKSFQDGEGTFGGACLTILCTTESFLVYRSFTDGTTSYIARMERFESFAFCGKISGV